MSYVIPNIAFLVPYLIPLHILLNVLQFYYSTQRSNFLIHTYSSLVNVYTYYFLLSILTLFLLFILSVFLCLEVNN